MPVAEFEEKQYETPANIELGLYHNAIFAPGQVLEAVVGYDVAAQQPQNAPIWGLIGVGAPTGIQLVPNLWQRAAVRPKAANLPSAYVSLILQYKRPHYLQTWRAKQWKRWQSPYYRFEILSHQHDALKVLEGNVQNRAIVRYACAAFWEYQELQTHQTAREVLKHSAFVSPLLLGTHNCWTYDAPGTLGHANAKPEEIRSETFPEFWDDTVQPHARNKENLFEHLRGVAEEDGIAPFPANDAPRWLARFGDQNALDARQLQAVMDIVLLADQIGRAGASWFVADLNVRNLTSADDTGDGKHL